MHSTQSILGAKRHHLIFEDTDQAQPLKRSCRLQIAPWMLPLFRSRVLPEIKECMRDAGVQYLDKTHFKVPSLLVDEKDVRDAEALETLNSVISMYTGFIEWTPYSSVRTDVWVEAVELTNEAREDTLQSCKAWMDSVLRRVDTAYSIIKKNLIDFARNVHNCTDAESAERECMRVEHYLDTQVHEPYVDAKEKTPCATKIQTLWRGYITKKHFMQYFANLLHVDDGFVDAVAELHQELPQERQGDCGELEDMLELFKDGTLPVPRSCPGWNDLSPEWEQYFENKVRAYHYLVNLFGDSIVEHI